MSLLSSSLSSPFQAFSPFMTVGVSILHRSRLLIRVYSDNNLRMRISFIVNNSCVHLRRQSLSAVFLFRLVISHFLCHYIMHPSMAKTFHFFTSSFIPV
jgi:hypothetical protein